MSEARATDANTLVLVDGSSYLYRAFHALPPLTNSGGAPTGAVKGVLNMLKSLLATHNPGRVAVVFDAKGDTFRNEMYAEYKANRPPMPDELRTQVGPLHSVIRALGLPLIIESGVEADDVIGTLACQGAEAGYRVIISSSDKDLAQLVNDRVCVVNTMDNVTLDREGVLAKFGVPPERIIDYLTLVGDKVDNVPGVDKCGPKTALKWLTAYGSLDGVMANASEIGGKVGENLRAALPMLPLSRDLVTIRCDLALAETLDDLVPASPDNEALIELYRALEFKSWLEALLGESAHAPGGGVAGRGPQAALGAMDAGAGDAQGMANGSMDEALAEYVCVTDETVLAEWVAAARKSELIAIDTETTSLDYMQARVVGVSIGVAPGQAAYIPFGHTYAGAPDQLSEDTVWRHLRPLLEDPDCAKAGHNLKYDLSVLANHDIHPQGIALDTMLESYIFNSTASRHDLDSLCLKYLGHRNVSFADVAGKGANQLTFDQVPLETATPYAAEDADMVLRLHAELAPRLAREGRMQAVLEEIEMPLVPVLSRMERTGVALDPDLLHTLSGELGTRMAELEKSAHALAGEPFNLGSPKQLQQILFEKLGLPVKAKTPKGQPSTAESVLAELAADYELPGVILDWRSASKLKSTYADALPRAINPETGRVHTLYHQAVAATGRLSSADPNLQNIPIRTAQGRRIRQAFIAPPGTRLVAADYSQIELRIMAHLSDDPRLVAAFAASADVHRATAAEVFGVASDAVTDDQRRAAKSINFGLIYGMSAFGLARQLGLERGAAQEYIDLYFARYPGVAEFMARTKAFAHEHGFVETVFGRRLYLPEIGSRNAARRQYAERTAINAPMQGTAADIIKRAMVEVDRFLRTEAPHIRMIMQVHDELVFEVPESEVAQSVAEILPRMCAAAELKVPLVVDYGVGLNWDEAH